MCKNIFLFLSIFLLSATVVYAVSDLDSISFATYYPSPYGSYHELHSDGISIGQGNRTQSPPANGLIVEGNVGIGITNPQAKLDVNGDMKVSGNIESIGIIKVAGQCFSPHKIVRCWRSYSSSNEYATDTWSDHMTWVDNEGECGGAGYSVEGVFWFLGQTSCP